MAQWQLDALAQEGKNFCQQLVAEVSYSYFSLSHLTIPFHLHIFAYYFASLLTIIHHNPLFQGLDTYLSFVKAAIALWEREGGFLLDKSKYFVLFTPDLILHQFLSQLLHICFYFSGCIKWLLKNACIPEFSIWPRSSSRSLSSTHNTLKQPSKAGWKVCFFFAGNTFHLLQDGWPGALYLGSVIDSNF